MWQRLWIMVGICGIVPRGAQALVLVPDDQPTIQAGIDVAANGDTVLVAPGTYRGDGNRGITFRGKGLVLTSVAGPRSTIIDCEGQDRGFDLEANWEGAEIAGFTVTRGFERDGGGLRALSSQVTLRNCHFIGNRATDTGGGVHLEGSAVVRVAGCLMARNTARTGAGMVIWGPLITTVSNCLIVENHADGGRGGGVLVHEGFQTTFTNCTFAGNRGNSGAALLNRVSSPPTLRNCVVWGNMPDAIEGRAVVEWTDIQDPWSGEGNISADPRFRQVGDYDYVLWPGSPCIDAGTGADDGVDWCRIHMAYCRHNSQAPDMGAYGGPGNVAWAPQPIIPSRGGKVIGRGERRLSGVGTKGLQSAFKNDE